MKHPILIVSILIISAVGYMSVSALTGVDYDSNKKYETVEVNKDSGATQVLSEETVVLAEPEFVVTHIKTPTPVKAIYMTSWVAATPSLGNKVIKLIEDTEANAIVLDIKDYTGKISFDPGNEELAKFGSVENRIKNIKQFIDELHKKNIYVIGRVAVFQDAHLVKTHPEWAVKTLSNKDTVWRDRKGIPWLEAGREEVWNYSALIAQASYDVGFDEINFDYIRFPSDGNMKDIYFPTMGERTKSEVMKAYFQYLNAEVRSKGIPTSADLFGMTTTVTNDMNIGQVLEDALPNFDFVAPMVYPSHFPATWNGYSNPATKPYEVIQKSMGMAVERARAIGENPLKLRPWLQDFNLGATYTADMVRKQIQATYDVGLDSWMLWDPANTYTAGGLESN